MGNFFEDLITARKRAAERIERQRPAQEAEYERRRVIDEASREKRRQDTDRARRFLEESRLEQVLGTFCELTGAQLYTNFFENHDSDGNLRHIEVGVNLEKKVARVTDGTETSQRSIGVQVEAVGRVVVRDGNDIFGRVSADKWRNDPHAIENVLGAAYKKARWHVSLSRAGFN